MGSDPGHDRRRPPSDFFTDDDDDLDLLPQPSDADRAGSVRRPLRRGDTLRLSGPTSFPVMVPAAEMMSTFRPVPPDGQTDRINFMLPEDVA